MLTFSLNRRDERRPLRFLCLGAHSDDIEIGCGGTVLRLAREHPNACFTWVVFSGDEQRAAEARRSADSYLAGIRDRTVIVEGFRDGYFPYTGAAVKDCFEQLKGLSPDVIFTHYRADRHQDHRLISDLTWNTFRDHLILEYEIPKYDGDLGSPNLFVHLDEATVNGKIDRIIEHFATQDNRHWFTRETFLSVVRLRGIESRSPGGYAEGFHCRKVSL
jgi:LmbE family N-acetylglucosaminyl deacetylase